MPRVDMEKLLARLVSGKPVPAIALLGDDAYLRETLRAKLVETLVPEEVRDWAVSRFSLAETDLDRILQQAQTLPMLAPRQVIFAEEADAMEQLGEEAREATVARLEAYLDDPAPFTTLIFEAAQLDQRMRLAKVLGEKALVVGVALDEQSASPAARAAMARRMARDLGVEIDPAAAEELVDQVDGQLLRMRTEMEKLASYVGERKRITEADVDGLVVTEKKYSIWQLAGMLAGRERAQALAFLGSVLREGEEPPAIVGALAWMYRTLIQAQELPRSASVWDAVRQLRVRKDTAEIALAQSRRIPRAQLLAGIEALYEADSRLKSGPADPRAVLEFLIARLTAPAAQSKRA